ncbi:MAG: ABC transporter substrate-binding protein [bacterium]
MKPASLVRRLTGLLLGSLIATSAWADNLPIKFTLDWKFQGPTSAFLLALHEGYYEEEGLDVTIDSGKGSAGAVIRVATGAYDMGFADINALIEYNTQNHDKAIKSVMMFYDAAPFSLFTTKSKNISGPKDLEGKTLGAPVFDASYKLFPAFAAATGINPDSVKRSNMDPALREAMMARGEVDFISGHYFSSYLDLKSKGVKESDLVIMMYADYGLDFYGNSVIASPAMVKENPEAVRAFLRATLRGLKALLKNPDAGIEATLKTDPLIDAKLERERLDLAIRANIMTPYVKQNGFGNIDSARMGRAVDQLALAYGLARKPAVSEIFTDAYLPAKSERMLP